jgi:hypothetical protein
MNVKLLPYAEEIIGKYQGGFQRVRSTVDHTFTMRQILQKCWEQNIFVHCLLIFKHHITLWRKEIWKEIRFPPTKKRVNLCKILK